MQPHISDNVRGPATGLMIAGGINALGSLLALASTALQLVSGRRNVVRGDDAYMTGYYLGRLAPLVIAVLSIIVAPIIIYGAIQMMKLRSYTLSKAAAILAIIPCTSLCCLVSIPVGIWALMTLNKPEVKQAFDQPPPHGGYGWNQ